VNKKNRENWRQCYLADKNLFELFEKCEPHPAWALYLFLITVADVHGLSYYGDDSICKRLSMSPSLMERSRRQLIEVGLLAYQAPLYQVLGLDKKEQDSRIGQNLSIGEILRKAVGGAA